MTDTATIDTDGAIAGMVVGSPLTLEEQKLRLIAAEVLAKLGAKASAQARADAAETMADLRNVQGTTTTKVIYERTELGSITVPAQGASHTEHSDVIFRLAQAAPEGEGALEYYAHPTILGNKAVMETLRAFHPELLSTRVTGSWKGRLLAKLVEEGDRAGCYIDPVTGEKHQVITYHKPTASGAVSITVPEAEVWLVRDLLAAGSLPARITDGLLPDGIIPGLLAITGPDAGEVAA